MESAHRESWGSRHKGLIWAGLLFGIGLGGFFDGIVLHQILQWHHMLTSEGSHPATTVAGLETNTLWDGLFHALTWIVTVAGLWLLWRAGSDSRERWPTRLLIGLLLMGWGSFNLVEGPIDHHILTLHHVREDTSNKALWDIAYLVWGAVMLVGGWRLAKAGDRSQVVASEAHRSPSARHIAPAD